jgi:hypothetical protein
MSNESENFEEKLKCLIKENSAEFLEINSTY